MTLPDATTIPQGWTVRVANYSTGNVTVNSATNVSVSVLTGGITGLFTSTVTTPAGGSWICSLHSAWPTQVFTNSMTVPLAMSAGTFQLTPAHIFNGPQAISRTGGTPIFRFPDAGTMISFIQSQVGLGSSGATLTPPVGFVWRCYLCCTAQSCATAAGTGCTFYPTTPPNLAAAGNCWDCRCWITSSTTYSVLFVHDP